MEILDLVMGESVEASDASEVKLVQYITSNSCFPSHSSAESSSMDPALPLHKDPMQPGKVFTNPGSEDDDATFCYVLWETL